MKNLLLLITALLISTSLTLYAQGPNYEWAHGFGDAGPGGADYGNSVATDSSGNVYVTGNFQGTVDFDPSAGTAYLTSAGGADIFLAKYDASGNYLWAKSMGGTVDDYGYSIALDGSGNAYITGLFTGTVDFDPSGTTANLTTVGGMDIFLAKYDGSGNYLWAKAMGGTGNDASRSIALDGSGNAYITGNFYGTADFDPFGTTANLTSAGSIDAFLAKYDAFGNYLWAKSMGGTADDYGYFITKDGSGNVYVTGNFAGTADFDPSTATANLTSAGSEDIFLAKYDGSGNYLWAKAMGGTSIDGGYSLVTDGNNNVYINGYFQGTADFDPSGATASLTSAGGHDIFLAKYDGSGNYLWAKAMGSTSTDIGRSVVLDSSGNAYITGNFNGTVDFDPSGATVTLTSAGGHDIFLAKYDGSGNYLWVKSMGGTNSDVGNSVTLDGSGNAYITGYFYDTADFDPSATIANLTSVTGSSMFVGKYDVATGAYNNAWATRDGQGGNDIGHSTAIDNNGNVYITGYFNGTVDFDPSAATANLISAGAEDIFLAKYDGSGNYIWAKAIGGIGTDVSWSVAIDSSGNVYITGNFTGTADFDPSGGTANLTSAGSYDTFLAKYDASGNYLWAKAMGGTGADYGYSMTLDGSGNAYITGNFTGTADFDPSTATANLTSAGSEDIFLAKYDASGNYLWAKVMGGTSIDGGYSLVTDGNNNVYITGYFQGTADFDPSAATANLTSAGVHDIFLAKYDGSGNYLWAKAMGGTDYDIGRSVALDSSGNIYITGNFPGTADFDPSAATANLSSVGSNDIFLAKYDGSGNYLWAKNIGGTSNESGYSVALNGSGNVYITGYFQGIADFDPSAATAILTSAGQNDIFLAKYDGLGNYLWAKSMGGTSYENGYSVALDGSGNIYITGYFRAIADFDPSAATAILTSAGQNDIFLAKYNQCVSTAATISVAACDSLVSPSGNYTWYTSNTYMDTIPNAAGCDSVLTINLTINTSSSSVQTVTACDSYTWINGITYAVSNSTAKDTLVNAAGCDSIVTLNLAILNSTTGTDVQTACDSYLWIDGVTYTASNNTATHTLTNAADCDSVVTLNLTILNSTTGTDVITSCDSHTWIDGVTYTSSNSTATYTLTNAAGCDSVVTLDLTILNSTTDTDVQTACDTYTWIDGVTYTVSNNTSTHTLMNAAGCDSVVTLDLTILNSTTGTDVQTACDSYTWINGIAYTVSNSTAKDTLVNAVGCDSVVTLNLTINQADTSVTVSNFTLTATTTGAAYQWLDCNNGFAPIAGENSQSFTATANSAYAVEVTENGCTDTSACFNITGTGIAEEAPGINLSVYPNPTKGLITIEFAFSEKETAQLVIYDMQGKLVVSEAIEGASGGVKKQIEMKQFGAGVYHLQVITNSGMVNKKVVVN